MTKNIIADFQLDIRITGTSKVTFGDFSKVIEGQNISIGTCTISDYFPAGKCSTIAWSIGHRCFKTNDFKQRLYGKLMTEWRFKEAQVGFQADA